MTNSNLTNRIKKAKSLPFVKVCKGFYQSIGSQNDIYTIGLESRNLVEDTPDGQIDMPNFLVTCTKIKNHQRCACLGNSQHTICYHGLGAIYQSFKEVGKLVSFFDNYHSAVRWQMNGKIAKIMSLDSKDCNAIWCVIKEWPN